MPGFGLACHLGVLADLPTIGVGKNVSIGFSMLEPFRNILRLLCKVVILLLTYPLVSEKDYRVFCVHCNPGTFPITMTC